MPSIDLMFSRIGKCTYIKHSCIKCITYSGWYFFGLSSKWRRCSEKILKHISAESITRDIRISWNVIAQLVLGTVRIHRIQVESIYGMW